MSAKKKTKTKKTAAKAAVGKTKAATPKTKASATVTKVKKPAGETKPKRVSALDAAATVLKKAGKPMHAQELIAALAKRGLWRSPAGATPWATLYAGMLREARDKGSAARFKKTDRGLFQFNT
ncbi:MAG: hypothetical protein HUU26_00560 [Gemmatimonadaceae bacterium]|nr:winged helix-turn-helix domain-containing protein [Phycisphaerae bacterium]NUQ10809.1 hypothetical protein [Gemmatimonadaceae bacterium]